MGVYEVGQICLNGHVITGYYNSQPESRKAFCDQCGERTIHSCQSCGQDIQGKYVANGVVNWRTEYAPPAFCHSCGQPFSWTERRLEAAGELARLTDELGASRDELIASLPDLTGDTPRATVAAVQWRNALSAVGGHAALALKEVLVDVVSETAKKMMFP